MVRIMSLFHIIRSIAGVTYREVLRDRILYFALFVALLLLLVGFLTSQLSFISPERILMDLGLTANEWVMTGLSILFGSVLLLREFDKRTAWLSFSRPIELFPWVLGKWLGLVIVLFSQMAIFMACHLFLLWIFGIQLNVNVLNGWLTAYGLMVLQSMILSSLAFLFSSFTTASLASFFSFGVYLIGKSIPILRDTLPDTLKPIAYFFPRLDWMNLGVWVDYGLQPSGPFLGWVILYTGIWVALALSLATWITDRKRR